jgi:hypothetical protein
MSAGLPAGRPGAGNAAFSAVSRAINASLSSGVAFWARFARETQLARVVSLIPRSSATSGTGFPVSVTMGTAPHETPP